MSTIEKTVREASALLAKGSGDLNLHLQRRSVRRSVLKQVIDDARRAATMLDRLAWQQPSLDDTAPEPDVNPPSTTSRPRRPR